MSTELSEQEIIRRNSLQEIINLGINPYPAEAFEVNTHAADIHENYERDKLSYKNISIAGRIMTRRIMGNASFAELQDNTGRIQIYIKHHTKTNTNSSEHCGKTNSCVSFERKSFY